VRAQRQTGWLRLVGHLPGLDSEPELFDFFLQGLAISHDLDARVYARAVGDILVLAARLPGDTEDPAQLSLDIDDTPTPLRISSVAEMDRLGWHGPPHELTVVPIGRHRATHVLAIRGLLDLELEPAILAACRVVGTCLDAIWEQEAHHLESRFLRRLTDIECPSGAPLAALMQHVIDDLARWVGAEHAAFYAATPGLRPVGAGIPEADAEPNRLRVPLGLPGPERGIEFVIEQGTWFTASHLRRAQAGTRLFTHWLLGLNQASQILRDTPDAKPGGGSGAGDKV
jgi:hypothetical protein